MHNLEFETGYYKMADNNKIYRLNHGNTIPPIYVEFTAELGNYYHFFYT